MRDTIEFFQEQVKQCQALAERARDKTDREFWFRLAGRWEELKQPPEPSNNPNEIQYFHVRLVRKVTSGRTRFTKRSAA
jgi:hypothetical protein